MAVRTTVDDGSMNAPTCLLEGWTSETNNLDLVPPCCAYGGAKPAIVFWLSNNPNATSMCSGGTSIGDTHLTNFNQLYYDFRSDGRAHHRRRRKHERADLSAGGMDQRDE